MARRRQCVDPIEHRGPDRDRRQDDRAGEYSLFIDLQPDEWTLVVSTWPAQTTYDYENKQALWGAYDYTADRDIVRTRMARETLRYSFDQLAWEFLDLCETGGKLAMIWDTQIALVPFTTRD